MHEEELPVSSQGLPLSRFKVLDLTRVRAGPTCVRQLADWGADVIKIEEPPKSKAGEGLGGPRDGFDFQNLHRNKRPLTLNLKSDEGKEIFFAPVTTVERKSVWKGNSVSERVERGGRRHLQQKLIKITIN